MTWNPLEVQPEETNAAGNRPDLIVRCGDGPERGCVLEIKRRGVTSDEGTLGQALSYAGHIGLRWVWLTNGQVWILADEKLAGPYKEREVLRLELGIYGKRCRPMCCYLSGVSVRKSAENALSVGRV